MKSRRTQKYTELLEVLPQEVQRQARESYELWKADPHHPGVRFKKVHATLPIWSARVNKNHRSVGIMRDDGIVWFWIGPHTAYERLLKSLK